jgi:hypothetical protein
MIDTNTFPSHQRLWQLFNDNHFKAVWPWDVASIGEDGEHIKQGTSHALEGTRDVDFLKEKFRSVGKMFEVAHTRWYRSGTNADSCFCLCGAPGFYTTSGYTKECKQNVNAYDGNPKWHPRAALEVFAWYCASEMVDEFGAKATTVLPAGVRMSGKIKGAGCSDIQQGGSVCAKMYIEIDIHTSDIFVGCRHCGH